MATARNLNVTPAPSAVASKKDASNDAPRNPFDGKSDKELRAMKDAIAKEIKARVENRKATLPQPGTKVSILEKAPKKWHGKEGTVVGTAGTRVIVQVAGITELANLHVTEVSA